MTATDSDPHPPPLAQQRGIILQRRPETCTDGIARGTRATIMVGDQRWEAIERADGYVRLPAGLWVAQFDFWYRGGAKEKALRIQYVTKQNVEPPLCWGILMHPATEPKDLKGCVGPGRTMAPTGVRESRMALVEIMAALGGWREGVEFPFEVRDIDWRSNDVG